MKKYALILISSFVLFVFGISTVFASIALPPADPTIEPPGKEISIEQQIAVQAVKRCGDNYERDLSVCRGMAVGADACYREARRKLRECMDGVKFFLHGPPDLILPNSKSPGQDNSNSQPAPSENAKANANNNAAFSTDPKPQPTCLPKGTKCTFMQTSRIFLDQIYRHMFECITPDGTTYYQYDTVFTDGRETSTALTKFIGESADKCIAYYSTVDPVTCEVLWYSQQNRCGTITTPTYSSP